MYTPELKLLTQALSPIDSLLKPKKVFKFDRFIDLIEHHRVAANLSIRLNEFKPILSEVDYVRLSKIVKKITAEQLVRVDDLMRVLDAFNSAGIGILPFKGPVLAYRLFGVYTARESKDLDVLLSPDDIEKGRLVMERLGYQSEKYHFQSFNKLQQKLFLKFHHNLNYTKKGSSSQVEMHWKLFKDSEKLPLSTDSLFANAVQVRFNGRDISAFSKEDYFIYLTMHGVTERYFRLKWLVDIHVFIINQPSEFDWEAILKKAKKLDAKRAVLVSLDLCQKVFGSLLPNKILEQAHDDKTIAYLKSVCLNHIYTPDYTSPLVERVFYDLRLQNRWWSAGKYTFKQFWVRTQDWQRYRWPGYSFLLLILLRPFLFVLNRLKHRNKEEI